MPVNNGVGWSNTTPDKAYGFEKLLSQHFAIVKTIFKGRQKYPYYYIDCTSGPGYIEPVETEGSPLIFLRRATISGLKCAAVFIERDRENFIRLHENISKTPFDLHNIKIDRINEDYTDVLQNWTEPIPRGAYGLIYFDPTSSLDFSFIERIFYHDNLDRIDLLIHISATTVKRCKGITSCTLEDAIKKINKTNWIIRDVYPTGRDAHQMTFILGTNWDGLKAMKKYRFYSIDSPKGAEILSFLSRPKGEYIETAKAHVGYRGWW